MEYNKLTKEEETIIINKGTEKPFSGEYDKVFKNGIYICRRCNSPLYLSESKFDGGCGWPAFDDEIENAVKQIPDSDGRRTEIVCNKCNGHLGHVFIGEGYTQKNTRHCVNSLSMIFIPKDKLGYAYFAAGCFWGVQHYLAQEEGVLYTEVGYTGGSLENPSYKDVLTQTTGHAEAVKVIFDPKKISYEELTKVFFALHDFEQATGQGPDIGDQYRSYIFYESATQKEIANKLVNKLVSNGYRVATEVRPFDKFYSGEEYHQNYYIKTNKMPYCHRINKNILSLF